MTYFKVCLDRILFLSDLSLKYIDNGAITTPYLEQLSNSFFKNVISFGVGSSLFSLPEYGGLINPIVGFNYSKILSASLSLTESRLYILDFPSPLNSIFEIAQIYIVELISNPSN